VILPTVSSSFVPPPPLLATSSGCTALPPNLSLRLLTPRPAEAKRNVERDHTTHADSMGVLTEVEVAERGVDAS